MEREFTMYLDIFPNTALRVTTCVHLLVLFMHALKHL